MNVVTKLTTRLNVSQLELGRMIGVSPVAVAKWKKANHIPNTTTLATLCNMTGFFPWELCEDFNYDRIMTARKYFEDNGR